MKKMSDYISGVIVDVVSTWTILAITDFHKPTLLAWCLLFTEARCGLLEHKISLSRAAESPCACPACVTRVESMSPFHVINRDFSGVVNRG